MQSPKRFNPSNPTEALIQLNQRVRVLEAYLMRLENRRPLEGKPVGTSSAKPQATTSWGTKFPSGDK